MSPHEATRRALLSAAWRFRRLSRGYRQMAAEAEADGRLHHYRRDMAEANRLAARSHDYYRAAIAPYIERIAS